MVGNTIVLKPASATMQCGIEIEKAFEKAEVPQHVFQTIVGDSTAAEMLIDLDGINAVTFTGSVPVGAKVAQRATSQIKKTVLELGGSDPFIVCEDADIEKASKKSFMHWEVQGNINEIVDQANQALAETSIKG